MRGNPCREEACEGSFAIPFKENLKSDMSISEQGSCAHLGQQVPI